MSETEKYVRVEVIARLFGVTVRRVQQLTQEGIIKSEKVPGAPGRLYEMEPTVQAYIAHLSAKATGRTASDKEADLKQKKLEAEIALKESQGELHRLKTDIQAGRYISVEEVRLDYQRFFVVLKKFLTAVPNRLGVLLAGHLDPVQVRALEKDTSREIAEMLTAFIVAATAEKKEEAADDDTAE